MSDDPRSTDGQGLRAGRPLHLLLADDSQVTQASVRGILQRFGHRVDVVSNGIEAIRAVEHQAYDAVLMDIRMPKMDGIEATRRLCELRPKSRRPPIIAISSATTVEDRERCLAIGMDDFVAKPVNGRMLQEVLGRVSSAVTVAKNEASLDRPIAVEDVPPELSPTLDAPIQVVVDGLLGELRIWSEHEWALLPDANRPRTVTFVRGLGWVGIVPKVALN